MERCHIEVVFGRPSCRGKERRKKDASLVLLQPKIPLAVAVPVMPVPKRLGGVSSSSSRASMVKLLAARVTVTSDVKYGSMTRPHRSAASCAMSLAQPQERLTPAPP